MEGLSARRLADQQFLGRRVTPGLVRYAAHRDRGALDDAVLNVETDGGGNEGKGVGLAIPQLDIGVVAAEAARRNPDGNDDLVAGQCRVILWTVTRQAM